MDPHHGRGSRQSQASSSTSHHPHHQQQQQQHYHSQQHTQQHRQQQQQQQQQQQSSSQPKQNQHNQQQSQHQRLPGASTSSRDTNHGVPKRDNASSVPKAKSSAVSSGKATPSSSRQQRSKSTDRLSSSSSSTLRKSNETKSSSFDRASKQKSSDANEETRSLLQSSGRTSGSTSVRDLERREPGTPAAVPKNRRRARSTSRPRDTSIPSHEADTTHKRSTPARSHDNEGVPPERIRLSSVSSSISNSERNPRLSSDKITKDESRRTVTGVGGDNKDIDRQSIRSDRPRFSRATSVPREIRSYRETQPILEESQFQTKRQSSHYEQLPDYKTEDSITTTRSSYLKSRPQYTRSDSKRQRDINETGISLANFTPPTHQRHHSTGSNPPTPISNGRSSSTISKTTVKHSGSMASRSYQDISNKSRRAPSLGNHRNNSRDREIDEDGERYNLRSSARSSVEEPLLPQTQTSNHRFHRQMSEGGLGSLHKEHIQTFPRMKQPESISSSPPTYPVSSATVDRFKSGKTHFLLDRIRNFTPNQLSNQEPYFSPLHKVPSVSSTSSDARSEVCLDLPDHAEDGDDFHSQQRTDLRIKLGFPDAPYTPLGHITEPHVCRSICGNVLGFLLSFLLIFPLLAVVLVIVPFVLIVKRVCSWCCFCGKYLWGRCCLCFCHTHLTSSEMVWLGRHSRANPIVQSLVVLQKGLDTERIRNLIESRLLSVENRHGRKLYPRFTQKVVEFCCGSAWVSDNNFVTAHHVFNMPGYIESLDDLQQFISKMASEPLSFKHPLWEVQVLHNFREPRDTVLLFRMHLCMTDGVSMMQVLEQALVDSQKAPNPRSTFGTEIANMSPFKVLFSAPFTFISRYLCGRPDFNLLHGRHFQQSGETVVAWSEPFSLSAALRVKQVARCTLADLLLSITAGNLRTYLQVCGITHPYNVTCAIPVDFQAMDGDPLDMENKYAVVKIALPTNTEGSIPRLWEVKNSMEKFKATAEAAIVNGARWLSFSLLPVSCFQRLWRRIYGHCSLLVSNLSGPTSVLKLDSREIKCMMYWIPLLDKVSVAISFLTYADQIRMAVISDRSALPNPELLTRDFNHKLEILSNLLAHRRIPGESSSSPRQHNVHLLSSFTMEDLTSEQIKLEMSLVQRELHDLKIQLDSGPSNHISHSDTQVMQRIEALKERSRELMMHLRKRKAEEAEVADIPSDDDDLDGDVDRPPRSFRRRTLSMSSKMSTTSVTSTARPLSTASTSNLPSPTHPVLPSWPEGDVGIKELDEYPLDSRSQFPTRSRQQHHYRSTVSEIDSPIGFYQNKPKSFHHRTSSDFS